MIKIENCEVLGWEHAIRGMRNPMNSWEKSDSGVCVNGLCSNCDNEDCRLVYTTNASYGFFLGENDHDLMMRLASAGPVHGKFRRMITVYVDITAPLYWWKEFDTYKVGTVANSCSTMHKIQDKEFTLDDFSREHLTGETVCIKRGDYTFSPWDILAATVDALNYYREIYNDLDAKIKSKDFASFKEGQELAKERKKNWWQMIQLLPSSYNQKRTVQLNYEVLANMYQYRKAHKLDEWVEFCKWVETLPYSEIITGGKGDD